MNRSEVNVRLLLKDLGKATLRGVRKCPKCGTYNGTRGNTCKNKTCNHVFKLITSSATNNLNETRLKSGKKLARNGLEAIRCITGSNSSNIYSVRVRDRGPDYRGFVEVPIIQGLDGTSDPSLDASFIAETTARCFVDVCGSHKVVLPIDSNNANKKALQTADRILSANNNITLTIIESCLHIKYSVKCVTDATPLTLKNSVLNMLPITDSLREEILQLARETPGPLVQRVSKNSLVVKCKPNSKQCLGYTHCSFAELFSTNTDTTHPNSEAKHRFSCSCKAFKSLRFLNNGHNSNSNDGNNIDTIANNLNADKIPNQKKCIHYYACICAFASDSNLLKEFAIIVKQELPDICQSLNSEVNSPLFMTEKEVETEKEKEKEKLNNEIEVSVCAKRFKKDENDAINTRKLIDRGIISENDISITFVDWLSSVTELINQTMHYQLNGHPEPLVFKIPQGYFDCLQQRIATGLRKKRLPNITTVFTRKDCPPLGTFTKYTYFITNIIHVKQIFDTTQIPLEIMQNFIENRDGSYDYLNTRSGNGIYNSGLSAIDTSSPVLSATNNLMIKPSELKTYLKVGLMSADQKEAIPFIIEWIPDILPKCHVGELRIQFQYGHLRNGRTEKCD